MAKKKSQPEKPKLSKNDLIDIQIFKTFQKSPIFFIKKMWGLTPQPLKPAYKEIAKITPLDQFEADWFEPFEKGKHITWQQYVILLAVMKALANKAPRRITVASGHGIGKSATMSWLLLWYLFCFKDAQIPCTAPTSEQMYDVLWKEVAKWLSKMPKEVQEFYDVQSHYVRMKESPETWFARAKTAKKESPEALAGVHGDHVMMLVDEASAVPEEIFTVAEGALTNENILQILISNPTRLTGFFRATHKKDKENWQCFSFDCTQSPVVDESYVERIKSKYGEDSDQFRVRVQGKFPKEGAVDDKGWSSLILDKELEIAKAYIPTESYIGARRLGLDVARGGGCENVWVLRTENFAKVIAKSQISDIMEVASETIRISKEYGVHPYNIFVDDAGVGGGVVDRLHQLRCLCNGVQGASKPDDREMFANKRAENFWNLKLWIQQGGKLDKYQDWDEGLDIKYKANNTGKIKIMSKVEMQKEGIASPDTMDALALTFAKSPFIEAAERTLYEQESDDFDEWDII